MTGRKEFIVDIETNGLTPDKIHCCGVKEVGKEREFLIMTGQEFRDFLNDNKGCTLVAHNGVNFDYPILRDLWSADLSSVTLVDSLLLSREAYPRRPQGNSLKAWGQRLGFPKGAHCDWSKFSKEMGEYCLQDLRVTEKVLFTVREELKQPSVLLEADVKRIVDRQIANGWLLDMRRCLHLLATLRDKKDEITRNVRQRFVPHAKFEKLVEPKTNKSGGFSKVGLGDLYGVVSGVFSRISFPEFNLGSRKQIGEYLMYFGWEPKSYTPTGQPVVDEGALEGSDVPEAKLIEEYLMVEKRIAMIQSWVDAADDDDRVHGNVNTRGAVTDRMTHSKPNMAQVTSNSKPYGTEMRSCWIAKDGYKIVGTDADGLELRMLAHYMNDPEYIKAVSEGSKEDGTDVHSVNRRAAGLPDRDTAKTFAYAFLYGAGDAKIGEIAGTNAKGGRDLKNRFLRKTPALKSLRERVEAASGRGYLLGLDKRKIEVRSTHAALNTLLQSAGAIVMKRWLVICDQDARDAGIDFEWVAQIHDEGQAEVRHDQAELFAKIAEEAMVKAGEFYNLRIPVSGTSNIGNNWSETH